MKISKARIKRKIMIQDFKRRKKTMNNELPKTKIVKEQALNII